MAKIEIPYRADLELELKDLNSKPAKSHSLAAVAASDEGSIKDDRPLLKPETSHVSIEELDKKFAPFVRRDIYGIMGRGQLPVKEKLLLAVAMVTLVPIRLVLATALLLFYYLICKVCTLFSVPNREEEVEQEEGDVQEDYAHIEGWRRTVVVRCGQFLSRIMLFVFGFYWIHQSYSDVIMDAKDKSIMENGGTDQLEDIGRPGAIISNHVSYLDILYQMSSSFPSFVAKKSVGKLPLVGLISKCLGCVYVQRESKSINFKGVSGVVTERVREAHRSSSGPVMMLFPEGTTSNGDYLLPFKTGAFLAGSPVLPVILRYPYQRLSLAWDSISGVRHVIFLLCQFVNYIEVIRLPLYYPSQQEKDDPKLYASNIRRLIASEGNFTMSDIGLAEKRIYHAALDSLLRQS